MNARAARRFIAYYRVSTNRQGRSGLGLEAQQKAVRDYLDGGSSELVGVSPASRLTYVAFIARADSRLVSNFRGHGSAAMNRLAASIFARKRIPSC